MVATADEQVAEMIRKKGWKVLTKGWPDILAYKPIDHNGYGTAIRGGQVMAIELKRGNDKLRADQEEMKNVFTYNLDVPFYVARDEDIVALTRKRGRIVVPWESLPSLQSSTEKLSRQAMELTRELARLQSEIDTLTHTFEEIPRPENQAKVIRTSIAMNPMYRQLGAIESLSRGTG